MLILQFDDDLGGDEEVEEELFHLLALERNSVLKVRCDDVEKWGHELNTKEKLCLPIQAPVEELQQGQYPVSLEHVVSVLSWYAEFCQDLDHQVQNFRKVL